MARSWWGPPRGVAHHGFADGVGGQRYGRSATLAKRTGMDLFPRKVRGGGETSIPDNVEGVAS